MFAAPNLLRHYPRGVGSTPRARPASRRFRFSDGRLRRGRRRSRGGQRRSRSQAPPAADAGAWLETWTPRGVYTSARTFRGIHVAWYGAHVARLRRMLASPRGRPSPSSSRACPCPRRTRRRRRSWRGGRRCRVRDAGHQGPGDALGAASESASQWVLAVSPRPGEGAYRVGARTTRSTSTRTSPRSRASDGPERLRLPGHKSTAVYGGVAAWIDCGSAERSPATILAAATTAKPWSRVRLQPLRGRDQEGRGHGEGRQGERDRAGEGASPRNRGARSFAGVRAGGRRDRRDGAAVADRGDGERRSSPTRSSSCAPWR